MSDTDQHRLAEAEPSDQPADAPRDANSDPTEILPLTANDEEVTLTTDHYARLKSAANSQHTVSESADKIVLKTNVKRGNATRDQDKIDVKIKGSNPEDTAAKLAKTLDALESEGIAQTLRETQPTED